MTQRILGSVAASAEGPTIIGIGGIHGNEPAGVWALEAVLRDLQIEGRGLVAGRLVAIAGNRSALAQGTRYVDRDLNRIWTDPTPVDDVEGREKAELLEVLDQIRKEAQGTVWVVDLHTTSGDAPPFVVLGDAPENRRLGVALPVPLVMGLAHEIRGTLLEYLDRKRWANIGFESGSHLGHDSVALATSALWIILGSLGLLETLDRRVMTARRDLALAADGFPRAVEVFYHHSLKPKAPFQMLPGFRSFQSVRKGDLLAVEAEAEVRAPSDGRLLMPLYQKTGSEGFFLAKTLPFEAEPDGALGLAAI